MMKMLAGVIAPVVTPFGAGGDGLDADAFTANIRAHLASGLNGVLVAGSTGEAALLDADERVRLVELARPVVADAQWLLAGTGAESTSECLRRTRAAAERGADAVLVVPPFYFGAVMTDDALRAHYARVADASPVPVLLYNIPAFTHLTLTPPLVRALAEHPNIIGMKDSAGDFAMRHRYLESQSAHFTVLTGHGGTLLDALTAGARGAVLAAALFAAPLVLELWRAFTSGDGARATEAQASVRLLSKEIVADLGPPGIKAAMEMVGLRGGSPRAPFLPLSVAQRARVSALIGAAGLARVA
jgi:4-hydroxy-2-oxoglutarate aldolase